MATRRRSTSASSATRRCGTNDFEVFSESSETVIPKVVEAYKWTATVCETGAGATDVSSSAYCTAS